METTIPRRRRVTAFRRAGWLGAVLLMTTSLVGPGATGVAATDATPAAAAPADVAPVCGTVPLDVELIIDHSGSMTSNSDNSHTREYWAQQAADALINDLQANGGVGTTANASLGRHRVGVTQFSGTNFTAPLSTASMAFWAIDLPVGSDSLTLLMATNHWSVSMGSTT